MSPATALGFLFSSLSFLCLRQGGHRPLTRALGRLFAWSVIAVGVVCLLGYLMSTACCFVLAGSSLLKMGSMTEAVKKDRWFSMEGAAILIGFPGLLSLLGYLYRVREFYGSLRYLRMAVLSAFCFLLLAGAILLVSPRRGIMGNANR